MAALHVQHFLETISLQDSSAVRLVTPKLNDSGQNDRLQLTKTGDLGVTPATCLPSQSKDAVRNDVDLTVVEEDSTGGLASTFSFPESTKEHEELVSVGCDLNSASSIASREEATVKTERRPPGKATAKRKKTVVCEHVDIIGNAFWKEHPDILHLQEF